MTLIVKTNGTAVRAYVGFERIEVAPDGTVDPVKLALGQLRLDCKTDRAGIMRDFRWHVEKRSDVFGRKEDLWQLYLARTHERMEAEKAARAEARAAAEAARPLDAFEMVRGRNFWADIYDPSACITSQKDYDL